MPWTCPARGSTTSGGGPAAVFGSSGGATVGLALVTTHPDQVHTLVAHEPPVVQLLPDSAQVRAEFEDVYATYEADGADKAMQKRRLRDVPGGVRPRPAPGAQRNTQLIPPEGGRE
jgi:pimeloyl-ACP methyl ester carboxylesterase